MPKQFKRNMYNPDRYQRQQSEAALSQLRLPVGEEVAQLADTRPDIQQGQARLGGTSFGRIEQKIGGNNTTA